MKILVLNAGSSSVKFQLIETSPQQIAAGTDQVLAKGLVDKIGGAEASVSITLADGSREQSSRPIHDHEEAIQIVLGGLAAQRGILNGLEEITGVGHRMVHGGERFSASVIISADVVGVIEQCCRLAPLHNPPNLKGYLASSHLLPHAVHVAVFDTAFHQTIPPRAYIYGIPYEYYQRDRIRRYGFHGTSHRYVTARYASLKGLAVEDSKLITCHLGNGCSVTAVDGGRSMDNSLGYTTIEGLMMGTRPGDLDPGVVLHLLSSGMTTLPELDQILHKESGLKGLSGRSNDMRDILAGAAEGDERCALALEVFCYRVKKYIGAYLAVLNGADAVVFTGGIAENQPLVRQKICGEMSALGIVLDVDANTRAIGQEGAISAPDSRVAVWVIPTNEELLIARDTLECIAAKVTTQVARSQNSEVRIQESE
jgi:acetate kinase